MRLQTLFAAALLAFAGTASAASLPTPSVGYSADREMETEHGAITGKVYHSAGKERAEMEMGGMKMVTITRPDKKVIWTLMPMQQMYNEIDFSSAQAQGRTGAPPEDVAISKVGSETVEGQETTKYKLIMKDKSAGGFVWLTQDNIPVKMDMLSKEGGTKTRVKMTLKNLEVGKQDASLFELPAGYQKMPALGGMGR